MWVVKTLIMLMREIKVRPSNRLLLSTQPACHKQISYFTTVIDVGDQSLLVGK